MKARFLLLGVLIGLVVGVLVAYAATPDVSALEERIRELEEELEGREATIEALQGELEDKEAEIESLERQLSGLEAELSELRGQLNITLIAVSFSRTEDTSSLIRSWIDRANESIRVMVMLITQDELADSLIDAHRRGVDVDVIIDDDWLYKTGSDYKRLLEAGVDIRGDNRPGLMHHKVVVIDGCIVITGSYNWSRSAEESNDENIIILRSSLIAEEYLEEFNRIWAETTPGS